MKDSGLLPAARGWLVKIFSPASLKSPSPLKSIQASSWPAAPAVTVTCPVWQAVRTEVKVTPSSSSKQLPTRLVPAAVSSPSAPAEGWPSGSVSTQEPRVRVVSGLTVWLAAPVPCVP